MKRIKPNQGIINKWVIGVLLSVAFACFVFFYFVHVGIIDFYSKELSEVSARSEDGFIYVCWNPVGINTCEYIKVEIACDSGAEGDIPIYYAKPYAGSYIYSGGMHGECYNISVMACYKDGSFSDEYSFRRLFLKYSELPNLPIVSIETESGVEPTFDVAYPEGDWWGASQKNNNYIEATIATSGEGISSINEKVRIKTRGNTSNLASDKHSYKIKFESKQSLMSKDQVSCKEWVLLNNGNSLNTYMGDFVGKLCGMEWQPQMIFVNVILNGDWKGCYCLTTSVSKGASEGLISMEGCLFENDAYWWNEDGVYFRTNSQIEQMAYTVKYPSIENFDDERLEKIKNKLQKFEDSLEESGEGYLDYIDEESYARWILARDILGNGDAAGSNMYFYTHGDIQVDKIKMGPLWDFDHAFSCYDSTSDCRKKTVSYFADLFEKRSFSDTYKNIWKGISSICLESVYRSIGDLEHNEGVALDNSWWLEEKRYNTRISTFAEQEKEIKKWFAIRVQYMDNLVGMCTLKCNLMNVETYNCIDIDDSSISIVDEINEFEDYKKIRGFVVSSCVINDWRKYRVGIRDGNFVYLVGQYQRDDIVKDYSSDFGVIGYVVNIPLDMDVNVCLLDIDAEIAYGL